MLVLNRLAGQGITITTAHGEVVHVQFIRLGRRARIGVEAPKSAHIIRDELLFRDFPLMCRSPCPSKGEKK